MPDTLTEEQLLEYDRKALRLLALARIFVGELGPYFMRLIHTLVPIPVPGLGTVGVSENMLLAYDPIRLVDDPEFSALDKRGLPYKLGAALVHECQHVIRGMTRLASLSKIDKELANIAADLAINGDMRRAGWELPKWACFPEQFDVPEHKTMEWYFQELLKNAEENKEKASGDIAGGGCGGVAGNPSEGEEGVQEIHESKGRTRAQVSNALKVAIKAAEEHFKSASPGDQPGWLTEAAEAFKESQRPERNWEKELAHIVRRTTGAVKSGGSDFSMSRPSRRSLVHQGLIRPGLIEQEVEVAIFWDTSGSMGATQLNKARQVTLEVLRQLGLDSVLMAQGDTKVQMDFTRIRLKDVGELKCHGRGGTNFCPVFERLRTLKPKPDVIMMVSDGDGPAPERPPPRVPVVWVIVPANWRRRPTDWGHYVICSNDHDVVDGFT